MGGACYPNGVTIARQITSAVVPLKGTIPKIINAPPGLLARVHQINKLK